MKFCEDVKRLNTTTQTLVYDTLSPDVEFSVFHILVLHWFTFSDRWKAAS